MLQLPRCSPASVTLQPAPGDTGKVSCSLLYHNFCAVVLKSVFKFIVDTG